MNLGDWMKDNFSLGGNDEDTNVIKAFIVSIDAVVLLGEYRVWMFGKSLTDNALMAVGFVAISAFPFLLAQLGYMYKYATRRQQQIAAALGLLGLGMSAYFGYSEFIFGYSGAVDDVAAFNAVALGTIALILLLIAYVLSDSQMQATIEFNKQEAAMSREYKKSELMRKHLEKMNEIRVLEEGMAAEFGGDAVARYKAAKQEKTPPVKQSLALAADAEKTELKN